MQNLETFLHWITLNNQNPKSLMDKDAKSNSIIRLEIRLALIFRFFSVQFKNYRICSKTVFGDDYLW